MANSFANAAARAAYAVDSVYEANSGKLWIQLDTGMVWTPIRGGAAAENWQEVFQRDAGVAGSGALAFERDVPLNSLREVDANGDVSNIAGNGGLLASDTTPILRGNAAETQEVVWAAGNADIVATQLALPSNFDGANDVTIELDVIMGGATDVPAGTIETGWDGGALVADTPAGGAASASVQTITATVAAADIPNTAKRLTLIYTPGTHANDTQAILAIRVKGRVTISA